MAIQHRNIPDVERHEPKGISTATIDQVYSADGAGSGTWKELPFIITALIDDVSTAGFVLVPIPFDVEVQSIRFVLANAITVADAVVTVTRGDGAAMGNTTILFTASAEGSFFDLVPSGNAVIDSLTGKYVKIATDGASTTASKLFISLKCKVV